MKERTAELKQRLIDEGFTHVFVHSDQPGFVYGEHTHPTDHAQIVLEGEITVAMAGRSRTYGPGERCDVPAGRGHSARIGAEGCTYLIGER